ncbi:MAG: tRNA (adenosine(37)-N6)-threonylcarbamoyltransferase complex dimerization subunit type 1 TsaB [Planctomycetota bacterium]|nr:tRNA (adenosine(37)-N6)-threonylcarbamoyltransferase complex dimerization subunit type 1 TsaB [Planctomycetota bacterium]
MTAGGGLVLAIDTSTRGGSVAIGEEGGALLEAVHLDPERGHGSDLMLCIERLVPDPARLRRVCVSRGPGSYTGLRVGLATAIGITRGTRAVLAGVGSLEAHALAAAPAGERDVAVLRFAFGGQVYAGRYDLSGSASRPRVVEAPHVVPAIEAPAWCEGCTAVVGDPRALELVAELELPLIERGRPLAEAVLEIGAALEPGDPGPGPEAASPLYLRAFEAKNRRR